jgi:adenylate kinase family enzyme
MKIAILGYSGSGKSTLAKQLGIRLNIPILYLDTVQFEANWTERDRDEALGTVADFMRRESWIIDGNYESLLQKERLELADFILILNFSRLNCLWRAYKRYRQYRNACRESIAPGCEEKMDAAFVWWILYKGRTPCKIRRYQDIIRAYPKKTVVLKNQRQLDAFLQSPFA